MLSHSGLKTSEFAQSSPNWPQTGPDSSQVVPSYTNLLNRCQNSFFILVVFKIYRTSKSNNLSFDHNNLIKNSILFCKFLSPLKSHRNGFVFKIYLWISVFRRKKQFENPILGCWDICKINTAPFFVKHPVAVASCS